jgi:ATP-binding cassette, subfamily B, bacterial PglK
MNYIFSFVGRRTIAQLLAASFILSILDLIGIASILPYLQILSSTKSPSLDYLNNALAFLAIPMPDHHSVVLWISVGLVIFMISKFVFVVLISRYQFKTFAEITFRLTDNIFKMLMQSEYRLFLKSAGSEIIGITHSSTQHATICFQAVVTLANEMIFLVLLIGGLLIIKPMATIISIATIGLIGLATFFFAVKKAARYGVLQQKLDIDRQKLAFATANSIKDIKIMGLEKLFSEKNAEMADAFKNITWRYQLLSGFPRIAIEHMFILIFITGTTVTILLGMQVELLLPVLGMIGLIALRVVPGFAKVISAYNGYRYSRVSFDRMLELYNDLKHYIHEQSDLNLPFDHRLTIENIQFAYGEHIVLSDISFSISKGQSVGIVGPSGSGKSTLLDVLTGLQKASSGKFLLDGVQVDPYGTNALKRKMGYVPQQIALLDESIAFNIAFEHSPNEDELSKVLAIANLKEFVSNLPEGTKTMVGEGGTRLSGGQKQRIGIARALYRNPEILVFDEATSALDNITERELSQEILRLAGGQTIIQVAHRLSTVENCDVIHVLENGKLVASGTHQYLLKNCNLYATMCLNQKADVQPTNIRETSNISHSRSDVHAI